MSIYRAGGGGVVATSMFTDHRLSPATRGKVPTHQGELPAHRGKSAIKDPYHRLGGSRPRTPVRGATGPPGPPSRGTAPNPS